MNLYERLKARILGRPERVSPGPELPKPESVSEPPKAEAQERRRSGFDPLPPDYPTEAGQDWGGSGRFDDWLRRGGERVAGVNLRDWIRGR